MISLVSLFFHSTLAITQSSTTTARCSWLPDLIKHTNDPQVIALGTKVCGDESRGAPNGITAMHGAVLLKNTDLMAALHQIGLPIDQPDVVGFTPLHHAAMFGYVRGVETLLTWGANPEHRNAWQGTYADLLRMNEPFREQTAFPLNRTLFSAHTNDNVVVDPRCQSKGVVYVDENVATSEDLSKMWQKHVLKSIKQKNSTVAERVKYAAFKVRPPKLSIKPVTHDDAGKAIQLGTLFCGVFAEEPIKKGDVITEYVGRLYGDERIRLLNDTTYFWSDGYPLIDSMDFRSAGAMINHAFPNAQVVALWGSNGFGVDGVPTRKMITAINDIAVGEQVATHYGDYPWAEPPVEMRKLAVRKFIRQNAWGDLYEAYAAYSNRRVGDVGVVTQYLAIIYSTENLLDLANEGLLTATDFKYLKLIDSVQPLSSDLKAVEKAIANRKKAAKRKVKVKADL